MKKISLEKFLEKRENDTNFNCKEYVIEGKSKLSEYKIWKAIKSRTTSTKRYDAGHYVLKGITCCEEWFNCFEQFYYDMGPRPSKEYSIDRIDNDGGYCKENCRWATKETQASNRGEFNDVFTYNGESKVLKAWAKEYNIKYTTLYSRIYRSGMSFEEAINYDKNIYFTIGSDTHTLKEWCEIYDMDHAVVYNRISKHKWEIEEALTVPKGGRRKRTK